LPRARTDSQARAFVDGLLLLCDGYERRADHETPFEAGDF
jgi:hypothetical protein